MWLGCYIFLKTIVSITWLWTSVKAVISIISLSAPSSNAPFEPNRYSPPLLFLPVESISALMDEFAFIFNAFLKREMVEDEEPNNHPDLLHGNGPPVGSGVFLCCPGVRPSVGPRWTWCCPNSSPSPPPLRPNAPGTDMHRSAPRRSVL